MGLQQSRLYLNYVKLLGWKSLEIDRLHVIYRYFPLIGGLAKLQRCERLPEAYELINRLKNLRIRQISVEPENNVNQDSLDNLLISLRKSGVRVIKSPFLPTKTRFIDLNEPDLMFTSFSQAKRRAVRRAQKNNLHIHICDDIKAMIDIKSRSAGFLGFITTTGMRQIHSVFGPQHSKIFLAYGPDKIKPVAGVLMLFHKKHAYYWIAGATKTGKKLFAPTHLVWETLKYSFEKNYRIYDFVGVFDERLPSESKSFIGFTRFKIGFGGKEVYYPINTGKTA